MIYVKVKTKNVRFAVPVPYALLHLIVAIVSSALLQQQINKWIKEHAKGKKRDFVFPPIDSTTLKPIVKELKKHKGIVLVDVKAKDGTEVKVRL